MPVILLHFCFPLSAFNIRLHGCPQAFAYCLSVPESQLSDELTRLIVARR
jgi:hypothetical protein